MLWTVIYQGLIMIYTPFQYLECHKDTYSSEEPWPPSYCKWLQINPT